MADNERILIDNAHVFTAVHDWNPGWLLTEGKRIRLMGAGQPPEFSDGEVTRRVDAAGKRLLPGLIDLHVHGAMGYEAMDASVEGLQAMAQFYARHGVTGFLPSTWTASGGDIRAVLDSMSTVMGPALGGAAVLGVHLEGPYLNPVRCGAQDAELIRRADRREALDFLETGLVRLIAIAPEYEENLWLIDECVRRGVTVSMGHTAATYEQVQTAVAHGLKHATHCYNAMTGLGHRELGTVGAAMSIPQITCELIADNIHVHPGAQQILVRAKGPDGVVLVTDAVRGVGLPDGEYRIDHRTITIRNGGAYLPGGTLAGSTLTMERALRNVLAATGLTLKEGWRMSSLNAAREIGFSAAKGSLEVGKDADLVIMDADFNVHLTMVEGNVVYTA
jgi:N-acetylglucosamine-6-phosphate deacetylase